MRNTLEGFNSRLYEEERISELEKKRTVDLTQSEQLKEKRMKKSEDSLRDLWDNIKWINIYIIGVIEREEREKRKERKLI
mgnify:CR=1 FL=1